MSYVRLIHRVSYRSHDTDGNSVCGKLIGYYSTIHRAQIEASGQAESGFAGQQDQNGIIENVYAVPVEYPLSHRMVHRGAAGAGFGRCRQQAAHR